MAGESFIRASDGRFLISGNDGTFRVNDPTQSACCGGVGCGICFPAPSTIIVTFSGWVASEACCSTSGLNTCGVFSTFGSQRTYAGLNSSFSCVQHNPFPNDTGCIAFENSQTCLPNRAIFQQRPPTTANCTYCGPWFVRTEKNTGPCEFTPCPFANVACSHVFDIRTAIVYVSISFIQATTTAFYEIRAPGPSLSGAGPQGQWRATGSVNYGSNCRSWSHSGNMSLLSGFRGDRTCGYGPDGAAASGASAPAYTITAA